jgi:hypothetical protein
MAEPNGQQVAPPLQATATPVPPIVPPAAVSQPAAPQSFGDQVRQEQQPAPQEQMSAIRAAIASRGFDVSEFQDDDAIINTFVQALPQIQAFPQLQQLAQYGSRYLENASDFEKWQEEQARQRQAQQPAPQPQSKWNPPEYDERWNDHVRYDAEAGKFVPKDQWSNPAIADKVNNFEGWRRKAADRLVREPDKVFWELNEERIQKTIDERVEAMLAQRQAQTEAAQFIQQNMQQFYVLGQNGQLQTDHTGQPVMTPQGQAFSQFAREARSFGITDENKIVEYASKQLKVALFEAQQAGQGQQPPQQPQELTPAQERLRNERGQFVASAANGALPPTNGHNRIANRMGSVASAAEAGIAQNGEVSSFGALARQEAQRLGMMPNLTG